VVYNICLLHPREAPLELSQLLEVNYPLIELFQKYYRNQTFFLRLFHNYTEQSLSSGLKSLKGRDLFFVFRLLMVNNHLPDNLQFDLFISVWNRTVYWSGGCNCSDDLVKGNSDNSCEFYDIHGNLFVQFCIVSNTRLDEAEILTGKKERKREGKGKRQGLF
jgi:hypothetical protein